MSSTPRSPGLEPGSGSLLGRVVAVFVVVLIISNVLVAFFETGRDSEDLSRVSQQILRGELHSVRDDVLGAQDRRRSVLSGEAARVAFTDAVATGDRRHLTGVFAGLLEDPLFDVVGVTTEDGFQVPAPGSEIPAIDDDLRERLFAGVVVSDARGRPYLLVAPRPVGGVHLFGGIQLHGATARALLSGVNPDAEVLLAVGGNVMARTDLDVGEVGVDAAPPGWRDGQPPVGAVEVTIDGLPRLAQWEPITGSEGNDVGERAWVGLVVDDPLEALRADLLRNRLLSIAMLAIIGIALSLVMLRLVTRPVSELMEAAQRIADGELDHDFAQVEGAAELEALAGALDRMLGTLRSNTRTISRQAAEVRSATQRIVAARDDERRRMAATLHDGFQQRLVVLRMKLAGFGDAPTADQRQELGDDVLALLVDLRRLSHDLYPSILRDRGLGAALHSLVGGQSADVDLELHPEPFPRLPLDIEANAYFLISEGLTNSLKHVPGVPVHMSARVFEDELEVVVMDEGPGFDVNRPRGGGLTGFEDRAAAVGGTVELTSDTNGTWVVARVPLPPDPERPFVTRDALDAYWIELMAWAQHVEDEAAKGHDVGAVTTRAAGTAGPPRRGG